MRAGRTTIVAAVAGALALTAFAASAAEAADTGITVSNVVVNGGRPVVVGTTQEVRPGVSFRVTWPAGHSLTTIDADPFLYRHDTTAAKGFVSGGIWMGLITCNEDGSRAANCTGDFYIDPPYRLDSNGDATTWKVAFNAMVWTADDRLKSQEYLTGLGSTQIKRAAKATANASPEPVAKGKTLTVTGLPRARTGSGTPTPDTAARRRSSSSARRARAPTPPSGPSTPTRRATCAPRSPRTPTATGAGPSARPPRPAVPRRPGTTSTSGNRCRGGVARNCRTVPAAPPPTCGNAG